MYQTMGSCRAQTVRAVEPGGLLAYWIASLEKLDLHEYRQDGGPLRGSHIASAEMRRHDGAFLEADTKRVSLRKTHRTERLRSCERRATLYSLKDRK